MFCGSYMNSMDEKRKDNLTRWGTVLVVLGVAVWGVYAVGRWGLGWDVTGRQFLPYHLAGVIPGMILRRRKFFCRLFKHLFGRSES
jgi:hypothetical protein